MSDFEKTAAAFSEAVADATKRKLEEIEQMHQAQWGKVAAAIAEAADAYYLLDLARQGKGSTTVFNAAATFRNKEAEMNAAVEQMMKLVAQSRSAIL